MDLSGIRERVLDLSKRNDLDTNDSNGVKKIDHFINAAIKWLDRRHNVHKLHRVYFEVLSVGQSSIEVRYLRSIDEIWVAEPSSDWERSQLHKVDHEELRAYYNQATGSLTNGVPKYYAVSPIGLSPEQEDIVDISSFYDSELIKTGDHWNYKGIQFYPPAEEAYTIRVEGYFYNAPLSDDADVNLWTVNESNLVVYSTLAMIEVAYRNRAGFEDWMTFIIPETQEIQKDQVQLEMPNGPLRMRG